jgi:hypothetical protein
MNGKQKRKLRRGADYNRSAKRGERCARDFLFRGTSREVARFLEARAMRALRLRMPNSIALRECALRWRNGIEQSKRQPSRPANERQVVAEEANESVRERDARHSIRAPAARIAPEHRLAADLIALRIEHDLRELPRVAQPDIESLAGDRMQRLRGIAERNASRARRLAGEFEHERKRAAIGDAGEAARPRPKWRASRSRNSESSSASNSCARSGVASRRVRSDRSSGNSAIGRPA